MGNETSKNTFSYSRNTEDDVLNTFSIERHFGFPSLSEIENYPDFDIEGENISKYFHDLHKFGALNCRTYTNEGDGLVVRLSLADFNDGDRVVEDTEGMRGCFIEVAKDIINYFDAKSAYISVPNMYLFFLQNSNDNSECIEPLVDLTRMTAFATKRLTRFESNLPLSEEMSESTVFKGVMFPSPITPSQEASKWHRQLSEYLCRLNDDFCDEQFPVTHSYNLRDVRRHNYGIFVKPALVRHTEENSEEVSVEEDTCVYKLLATQEDLRNCMTTKRIYSSHISVNCSNIENGNIDIKLEEEDSSSSNESGDEDEGGDEGSEDVENDSE